MSEKNMIEAHKEPVPYIVFEGTVARFERTIIYCTGAFNNGYELVYIY